MRCGPAPSNSIGSSSTRHGKLRAKLPAVSASGLGEPLPSSVYTPQATPDRAISNALANGGADTPGNSSTSRPAKAISMPSSMRTVMCSPLYHAKPNIVICTAPNSNNAPTPAPSCR
ncbi:hypothetical protein D9M71_493670 [compost metagenome]